MQNESPKIKMLKLRLLFLSILFYTSSFGQSGSFSFTSILEGGEMAVHGVHDFQGKGIVFLGDILGAERSGQRSYFSFVPNSSYLNCSDNAHVNGYVRSYQSGDFIFPIGNELKWRPVAISGASDIAPTDAAYFFTNPATATLPLGSPFPTSLLEGHIRMVSNLEFWDINGTIPTKLTLSWGATSDVDNLSLGQLSTLRIVGWNGSKWMEIPSEVDSISILNETSTLTSGSITTLNLVKPDSFEIYTIGSIIKDTDGDGVTDGDEARDNTDLLDPCSYNPASQDYTKTSAAWRALDCDGDGLTNGEEVDPDGDGIPGPDGTNPLVPDSTILLDCNVRSYAIANGVNTDINVLVAYSNGITQSYPEGEPFSLNNGTLTATLQAGTINPDGGHLVYRVQGTPDSSSVVSLPVYFGRKRCEIKIWILEPNVTTLNFSVFAFNDKNNNCIQDAGENERDLPAKGLFIKVFDLNDNLLFKNEILEGQFEVLDFAGSSDVIYYYIIDNNDLASDNIPTLPEGWKTGMAVPALKRYFHFDGSLYKTNPNLISNIFDDSWDASYPFYVCLNQSEGKIASLNCANAQFSGTLTQRISTSETFTLNYSGANGGFYPAQIVKSKGVAGLTATLNAGSFSDGEGSVTFSLSGVPAASGKGTFDLLIGGISCQVDFTVLIPELYTQDINITNLNVPVSGNLSINDVVPHGASYVVSFANVKNPAGGELKLNLDGTYTFVATKAGVYSYVISICDLIHTSNCAETLLQITVLDPYSSTNAPVVNPDIALTVVNTSVKIAVLANDQSGNIGTDLIPSSLTIIEQATNGTTSVNADGTIIYTPNAGFIGSDSFIYQVCDSAKPQNCQSASVSIQILADRIVATSFAVDDYIVVKPNSKAQRFITGNVLINDHSSNPTAKLKASLIQGPSAAQGSLVFDADGSFSFTAADGFTGTIAVVYMLCDDASPANCSFATLHILVEAGDFDGDGVGDLQEALDGTNPKDPCSFKIESQTFVPSLAWTNADCDGDGVINSKEKFDGTNALDPCEFKLISRTVSPSEAWRNEDCDGDGLSNELDGVDDCDNDGIPNFLDPDTCNIDILMPNVFTPNGDGINDVIKPFLLGIEKFVCFKVYNRWGNIIFETQDRDKGWNGEYRTQGQGTETFQWLAEGYDRNGKLVKRTGMITLLR